jgi:RimJ/RimL family protein N-acetyltransferase
MISSGMRTSTRKSIEGKAARSVERIELIVFDNNQDAIALYLKFGFKVEGKMEKFIKIGRVL